MARGLMSLELAYGASFCAPLVLPLFTRTVRGLAICAAILLALIVAGYQADLHDMHAPNHHDTPGDAFGALFFVFAGMGLAVGVVARLLVFLGATAARRPTARRGG